MEYLVGIVLAILAMIVVYVTINPQIAEKISVLHEENAEEKKNISVKEIRIIVAILSLLIIVSEVKLLLSELDLINLFKMNIALICLAGSGCIDYRERRIPNIFVIILFVSAFLLLIIGIVVNQDGAFAYVQSSVFASAVTVLGLLVIYFISNHGIGLGDIKLLGSMALTCGVYAVCATLFISLVFSALVAIVLLITKKQDKSSSIPFGPLIILGYIATILLSLY